MSYTTWRLFRQVSRPSAKWRVFCLPTANTHTHTQARASARTRPPTPYFYRKLKFIGRYRMRGHTYICILIPEIHICGSVRNSFDTNSSTPIKCIPKSFEQPVIQHLIQIWSNIGEEPNGRRTQPHYDIRVNSLHSEKRLYCTTLCLTPVTRNTLLAVAVNCLQLQ